MLGILQVCKLDGGGVFSWTLPEAKISSEVSLGIQIVPLFTNPNYTVSELPPPQKKNHTKQGKTYSDMD